MHSFDFYDTLFVRLVARPADLFRLIEERLNLKGFTQRRIDGELGARRLARSKEVTIDGIYDQPDLKGEDLAAAKILEIEFERTLIAPIWTNARRIAASDIVVSDMYLSSGVLREILQAHLAPDRQPRLVVSSEVGLRKSDGQLWKLLKQQHPQLVEHTGDSKRADVLQPRRHGIRSSHFRGAELNRYERRWASQGDLDGSLVAGLSRAARLSSGAELQPLPQAEQIDATFASVIAPALVAFVESVIDDCQARGIHEVAFLARDGQLLLRIAERIIKARALPLRAKYIYGSRHALHLPGLSGAAQAESWLLEDTQHLSLVEVARRGELPLALVADAGRRFGYDDAEANIPRRQRGALRQLLRLPEIEESLRTTADAKWRDAFDYYAQAGLLPGAQIALVDIGWTGRMQASLRRILDKGGGAPVHLRGYYLCLSTKLVTSEQDVLTGFLHDPDHDSGISPFDVYRVVAETALMADHATTLGFQREGETIAPVFGPALSTGQLQLVARQQAAVVTFVDLMLKLEQGRGARIRWSKETATENFLAMLQNPTRTDAEAFSGRAHFEGQGDDQERPLLLSLPLGRDLFKWQSLGFWPEGTYAASAGGRLLFLMRLARRLKNAIRSRASSRERQQRKGNASASSAP